MKTYDKLDDEGRLVYFEVGNALLSRRGACKVVAKIPGVVFTSKPGLWPFNQDDTFGKFQLDGNNFELWEPWGDNSRFHVSAKPLAPCPALDRLQEEFRTHRNISGITRWLLLVVAVVLIIYKTHRG